MLKILQETQIEQNQLKDKDVEERQIAVSCFTEDKERWL
jgi:hypothetical protein